MRRQRGMGMAVFVALVAVAGCAREPETETQPAADTIPAMVEAPPPPDPVAELRRIEPPPSRVERIFQLLFVNPGPGGFIVWADAGAEPAHVDSVVARDSLRVDLVVRADSVRLHVEPFGGSIGHSMLLRYPQDSVRRIELAGP